VVLWLLLFHLLGTSAQSVPYYRPCYTLPAESPDVAFLDVLTVTFGSAAACSADSHRPVGAFPGRCKITPCVICEEQRASGFDPWGPCSIVHVEYKNTPSLRDHLTLPLLPNVRHYALAGVSGLKYVTIDVPNTEVWKAPWITIDLPDLVTLSSSGNAKVWTTMYGQYATEFYFVSRAPAASLSFPFLEYVKSMRRIIMLFFHDIQLPRFSHSDGFLFSVQHSGDTLSFPSLVRCGEHFNIGGAFKTLDLPKFRGEGNGFVHLIGANQLEQLILPELGLPASSYSGTAYPLVGVHHLEVKECPLLNFISIPHLKSYYGVEFSTLPSLRKLCLPELRGPHYGWYANPIVISNTALREVNLPNAVSSWVTLRYGFNPFFFSVLLT
jgi:hypothetical protein